MLFFWKRKAKRNILQRFDFPDGYALEQLDLFTAQRGFYLKNGRSLCKVYTKIFFTNSPYRWTNGHIIYDIETGERLSFFHGEGPKGTIYQA